MFHMMALEQMLVNNLSQKIFLADAASESMNRIDSISNIYLYLIYLYFIALDYPT